MKILLLGATGRTGKHVLNELLKKGFKVNCLVRDSKKLQEMKGVSIFQGDVGSVADLQNAAHGCEAIINVLNIARTSDFPWAALRTPKDFLSIVMGNILALEIKPKVILCSTWGVAETKKDIPFWFRWLIDFSNIGVAYLDHEEQERILENSELEWVIVRPVGLTNFSKKNSLKVTINNALKPSLTISRKSLAYFLVDCLERGDLLFQKVVVSDK